MPAFMREVGDVHRELYPEHAELYGENIRGKIERCLAVTDAEYERRPSARGRSCASAPRRRSAVIDLLFAPSLKFVAPPADIDEPVLRGG